jgi:hypothetical protein
MQQPIQDLAVTLCIYGERLCMFLELCAGQADYGAVSRIHQSCFDGKCPAVTVGHIHTTHVPKCECTAAVCFHASSCNVSDGPLPLACHCGHRIPRFQVNHLLYGYKHHT